MEQPSTFEVIELLSGRFLQVEFPESFIRFIQNQEANNHQIHRLDSEETLVKFLRHQGVPPHYFSSFLSQDSRLIPKFDYAALLELPPEEVYTFILDRFSNVFYLLEIVLDSETDTGFNRHGRDHLSTVARNAIDLFRAANILPIEEPATRENEVIIGAFLHDLGNLISRKYHGLYGIYMFIQLFENFAADEKTLASFLRVLEIILFHEVEYGSQLPTLDLLHRATLSVIIADKTDVSFKRVSAKSNVAEALQDAHVLVNLLVAGSTIRRIKGLVGRFRWTIDFKPKFDTTQVDLFSSLLKATGRVKFPKEWQTVYEEANIEYLFLFNSTFLSIYLSRLYYAIRAVFALYPSVEKFQFVVDDLERGISLMREFTPDDYHDKIFILGKHFYRKEWSNTYIYKVLERQRKITNKSNGSNG